MTPLETKLRVLAATVIGYVAIAGAVAPRQSRAQEQPTGTNPPTVWVGTFDDPQTINLRLENKPLPSFGNGQVIVTGTYGQRTVEPNWATIGSEKFETDVKLLFSDYGIALRDTPQGTRWIIDGPWAPVPNGVTLHPHVAVSPDGPGRLTLETDSAVCLHRGGSENCTSGATLPSAEILGWRVSCTDGFTDVCTPDVTVSPRSGLYAWPGNTVMDTPPFTSNLPAAFR